MTPAYAAHQARWSVSAPMFGAPLQRVWTGWRFRRAPMRCGPEAMRTPPMVELARELGLRVREASLLDARAALREAARHGAINVTEGTKGGRGRRVDRWVPVPATALQGLRRAAAVQGEARNLVPPQLAWRQWNDHLHHVWAGVRGQHGLGKLHGLWAAWACERYIAGASRQARTKLVRTRPGSLTLETAVDRFVEYV